MTKDIQMREDNGERIWLILAFEVEQSDVGPAYTSKEAAEAHIERDGGTVVKVELNPVREEIG